MRGCRFKLNKYTIMTKPTEKEVLEAIRSALNIEEEKITRDTKAGDIAEWDSLGHLTVLVELDKLYEGKIGGIKDLASVDSVGRIIEILKEHSLL